MAIKNEKVFRSFVKGLITEASALTFPENASVDEQNFILNRDGSRSRRLGVDYEDGYALTNSTFADSEITESRQSIHRWDSPGGDASVSIGVVRINSKLFFINLLAASPSNNLLNNGNAVTLSGLGSAEIQVSIINNKCVIVSEDLNTPVLLTYNRSNKTVSQSSLTLEIRDLYGVDDGLDENQRPSTLSNTHKYNLRNQGWNTNIKTNVTGDESPYGSDALEATKHKLGVYPSNSDQWTLGKISDSGDDDYEKFDPNVLSRNSVSNYQVPKGSFIIDAFNRGTSRNSKSDVKSGLPLDRENGNISTVASYAQRVFYSGVKSNITGSDNRSPNYSSYIFFSKVVTSDDDLGKCYQENDPTDPGINDLIDSDGGTIQIPEASHIVKIASSQSSLLVFCENGIWEIYGDTGGFFATSFQASKISTNGVTNANSVVDVNGNFLYWSKAGIYMLSPDTASGRFRAQSISLTTIQQIFVEIPQLGKDNCKGFYEEKENRVRWLYNDDEVYDIDNNINNYTKELVYDLTLEAWSKNVYSFANDASPHIAGYVDIPSYAISSTETNINVGSDAVIVTDNSQVVIDVELEASRTTVFSFLTIKNGHFTLSKYKDTRFVDWYTDDIAGANYSSYLVTGYEAYNDLMREKQVPYIFFYFTRTEDSYSLDDGILDLNKQSSCKVQAQWNWANNANSGKWGNEFQAYRLLRHYISSGSGDSFDYGLDTIVTKNKLRGSGKVLSLKISSEEGKDMKLLGWATPVTATSVV